MPEQAVDAIDRAIGGITAVYFKAGKKFTIQNHNQVYPLRYNGGIPRRKERIVYNLAYFAYQRAQQNGNARCGELHMGANASTKHHRHGLMSLN